MNFRIIEKNEYPVLTDIHIKAFNDFFLTTLGEKFLRIYYKACLKSNESIGICAVNEDSQIIGFSIGCTLSKGFHKRLIRNNFFNFLWQGISILLRTPKSLFRLAKNLEKTTIKTDDGNYAELLSIAVLPEKESKGVGKGMISKFEAEAIKRGCEKMVLTTDFYDNKNVLKFYEKTGYKVFYEFTTYPNRKMYKMIKLLII